MAPPDPPPSDLNSRKLIVGLGNPGARYESTRHNVGFECLHRLHQRIGKPSIGSRFEAQWCQGVLQGRQVCLIWPLTYMNASGRSVKQFLNFFKIPLPNLIVVCDDLALPLGRIRIRKSGSSGGQKGLGDILRAAGSQDVPRLRIGIGSPPPNWDPADYVLAKFKKDEQFEIDLALAKAVDAIEDWIEHGIDSCMNRFNKA